MEDSGREDLLKQKSAKEVDAQNNASDEKVDFDSSEIGQKEKEEQFKDIEGAEERAREAERLKEKAMRDKEKADEAAAKALKKEEETPLQKKARHKRNWIIAAIVFVVLAVLALLGFLWWKNENRSEEDVLNEVSQFAAQMSELTNKNKRSDVQNAKEQYMKKIESSHGRRKLYYILSYIKFASAKQLGFDECKKYIEMAGPMAESEQEKDDLLDAKCFAYSMYGSEEYYKECVGTEAGGSDEE